MSDRLRATDFLNRAVALAADKTNPANADQAWKLLCSSAVVDPNYADALVNIGMGCTASGQFPTAIAAWKRVLETDAPDNIKHDAKVDLANKLHHTGRNREARAILNQLLGASMTDGKAWTNLSLVESVEGELDASLQSAECGFQLDPETPTAECAYAFALLYSGHYAKGLEHFEARFPYRFQQFLTYPYPKWRGEEGKDVWVVAEQGIGDTLSFARFVEPAAHRAKSLRLAAQQPLFNLLASAFSHLKNVTVDPLPPNGFPAVDHWSSFMSLPFALELSDEEIISAPPIAVPPYSMATTWKADRKFHIGIAWFGSPASDINHWRSFPFHELLRLYDVPGVQLYSLQLGEAAADLHKAGAAGFVRDLSPYIKDVTSTLALVRELDLVVTTESLLGHICALAGTETWIPYSYMGRDFRIGHDGTKRLWTPKHRIFKQDETMRWGPVFDRIVDALGERA